MWSRFDTFLLERLLSEVKPTRLEVIPASTRMDAGIHAWVAVNWVRCIRQTIYVWKLDKSTQQPNFTGDSADATNNGYYATRTDKQDIARSPLAKLLFAIDGVKAVYLGPEKKKQKKRNANPTHVHVPGVDPSQDDIAWARELQQIKPPKCFCGWI